MKFEFNPKTGNMEPKKNEEIYFGKTIGGGLRIDDKKHNIAYVIERDGRITWLFGSRRDLHVYDQRDAHIIEDRVKRIFGTSHEYATYKKFMVGLEDSHLKKFDEFVNE